MSTIWNNNRNSIVLAVLILCNFLTSIQLKATTFLVLDAKENPLEGAQIIIIQEKTAQARTFRSDNSGIAEVEMLTNDPVMIFCAHPDCLGWERSGLHPKKKLSIKMKSRKGSGSIVSMGSLPGIEGAISARLVPGGKLEITGSNVRLGEVELNNISWKLKKPLKVVDDRKHELAFSIQNVASGFYLIDYKKNVPEKHVPELIEHKQFQGAQVLVINEGEEPIIGSTVLFIHAGNNTVNKGVTGPDGIVRLENFPNEPMIVYCAHEHYRAYRNVAQRPYGTHKIILQQSNGVGSAAFPSRTGYLPGLKGRLNPILDDLGRYYVYAKNIAIDGGKQQPVKFELGRPIRAVDSTGTKCILKILEIRGDASLLEYQLQ